MTVAALLHAGFQCKVPQDHNTGVKEGFSGTVCLKGILKISTYVDVEGKCVCDLGSGTATPLALFIILGAREVSGIDLKYSMYYEAFCQPVVEELPKLAEMMGKRDFRSTVLPGDFEAVRNQCAVPAPVVFSLLLPLQVPS
jgi:SAM-dependent methyltransferase